MIKLVFKYLLPLALLLVVGIVSYNYYYGSDEEKKNSQMIFSKVKGLGSDVFNLLVSEKEKFGDGKYDDAMEKIGNGLTHLKDQAIELANGGQQWLSKLNALEQEKEELEQQLSSLRSSPSNPNESTMKNTQSTAEQIEAKIKDLANRIEQVGSELDDAK